MKENPTHEAFLTIRELATILKISESTIYRNPAKFHMFKVGGSWRANAESLEKFTVRPDQAYNCAFAISKTGSKKRYQFVTSSSELERELEALLAPSKKHKTVKTK